MKFVKNMLTREDKRKISDHNFDILYNPKSNAKKMAYVNLLRPKFRQSWIRKIELQIPTMDIDNAERMTNFLKEWKNSGNRIID